MRIICRGNNLYIYEKKIQPKMCRTKSREGSQSTWRYELEIQEGMHIKADLSVHAHFHPLLSLIIVR